MAFTAQLGTEHSQLGQMVLGFEDVGDPLDQSVESVLTLSQIVAQSVTFETVTSTLTLVQQIDLLRVLAQSVGSTLTLSQVLKIIKTESATSTLTLLQNVDFEKANIAFVTSTLALTQAVVHNVVSSRLISQDAAIAHTVFKNQTLNLTVASLSLIDDTFVADRVRLVENILTLSQAVSYTKLKHVQDILSLESGLTRQTVLNRTVRSTLYCVQPIVLKQIANKTVVHFQNLNQDIVAHKVYGIEQSLPFSQTVVGVASKGANNTLTLAQTITKNIVSNPIVINTLLLTGTVVLVRTRSIHVRHTNSVDQRIIKSKVSTEVISQTLTLTDMVRRSTFVESVPQTLTLTQTVGYTPTYPRLINQALTLGQDVAILKVYNRSVEDQLVFPATRSVYVGLGGVSYIELSNVQHSLVQGDDTDSDTQFSGGSSGIVFYTRRRKPFRRKFCVLSSPNGAITLPTPEFSDSLENTGTVVIKKSMNNVSYTYIQGLNLKNMKLNFVLAKAKAWELREFLIANGADNSNKIIDLYTWKGEKWKVYVTTNPLELVVNGRYSLANEKVNVSLEFEGFKVM